MVINYGGGGSQWEGTKSSFTPTKEVGRVEPCWKGAHTVFEVVLTQTFKVLGLVLLVLVNLFTLG